MIKPKPTIPADDGTGFLSRWSQRKSRVQPGEPAEPPLPSAVEPTPTPSPAPVAGPAVPAPAPEAPPPPTLDDVAKLTRDADFTRFVRPDVDGPVRNAALKKLFADPHYNVMDGLDTYIDDYGRPDPLPKSMLRRMAQSAFLGLLDDDDDKAKATVQVAAATPPALDPPAPDEDPDLRLQPDDAAAGEGPEPGAGEDPGRER